MKISRRAMWIALALALAVAAFLLRDVIYALVILPLEYLWWVLSLTYRSLAQGIYWVVLVALLAYLALDSLYGRIRFRPRREPKHIPARGPVETMAWWLEQTRRGNYFKWRVANRLGELAEGILARDGGIRSPLPGERLRGAGWSPPPVVQKYLEAGLNHSFADYPRPRWFQPPPATPFDLDIQQVLDYLDSQMESRSDHKRT